MRDAYDEFKTLKRKDAAGNEVEGNSGHRQVKQKRYLNIQEFDEGQNAQDDFANDTLKSDTGSVFGVARPYTYKARGKTSRQS